MRSIEYTLHDGSKTDEVTGLNDYKVIAKRVTTDNLDRFFLKEINCRVVNPAEVTVSDMRQDEGKLIEVSEEVYTLYHRVINHESRVSFTSIQNMMS